MTEPTNPQSWLRKAWERRFRVMRTTVYPAKTIAGVIPPKYREYIVAWGGKWRFRVRPESQLCPHPPRGWYCLGDPSHDGPCAAWPRWWAHPIWWLKCHR